MLRDVAQLVAAPDLIVGMRIQSFLHVSQQLPLRSTATSRLYRPCRSSHSLHSLKRRRTGEAVLLSGRERNERFFDSLYPITVFLARRMRIGDSQGHPLTILSEELSEILSSIRGYAGQKKPIVSLFLSIYFSG